MKQKIKAFISRILDTKYDFRIRSFYILAIAGIIMSLFSVITSLAFSAWSNAVVGAALNLLSVGMLIFTRRTGKYKVAYAISIGVGFLMLFPMLFFTSGGYRSGVVLLFIFAVIFTVLMLKGKAAVLISFLEIILYAVVCIIGYYHPEYVSEFETEGEILIDVILSGCSVSITCCIVLFLHLREYSIQSNLLKEKNEKLKHYDEAKSTFLTTVAHEIKNPLNSISLHARDTYELLEEEPLEIEVMRENLKIIEKSVVRIDRIVVDLMDTVAIEQGRLALSLAPMRLATLLREESEEYFRKNYNNGNQLVLDLDEELPPISADYARIEQVLFNLLSNAIKYTKNGTITITLSRRENNQIVCVSDNGQGMSEQMRERALEGYVSASKEYWRHGIGLFVSHQIVEAHGGKIWIESKFGEGTKVAFILPEQGEEE